MTMTSSEFSKLVHGEGSVVRLDDGVGHVRGRADGEGLHDSVRVFLADLGDQKRTHTGAGSSAEGVGDLETLEAVASLSFLSDDVEDGVHGSRFQVHQDSARDLTSTGSFVVLNVDTFELQVGVTALGSSWVNTVFMR